jgi:hypothetical protein
MDGHNLDESEVIFLMRTTGANQLVGGNFSMTLSLQFLPSLPTFLSFAVVYVVRGMKRLLSSCTTTVLRYFTSSTPFLTTLPAFFFIHHHEIYRA